MAYRSSSRRYSPNQQSPLAETDFENPLEVGAMGRDAYTSSTPSVSPYSRNGGYQPGRNPINYNAADDIHRQNNNNRDLTQGEGDAMEGELATDVTNRRNAENFFGDEGWNSYQDLNQNPGYTAEERSGIMGQEDLTGLRDNINYGQNNLSDWENDAIRGNPYKAADYLDPEGLSATNDNSRDRLMGGVANTETKLGANVNSTRDAMSAAVDPMKLGQSEDYRKFTAGVLDTTGGKVWDAATNEDLDMSGEYARQAGMSDQEVADTASMGGQAIGAGQRAAVQDLERQAAASGNASPLAVAAARREFEDQGAVNSADAVVRAQLAARGAQREAATGVENTRSAANRYKAGAQMQSGMDLGNFAQGTLNTLESNRQAGERDISNRGMDIAQTTGQMGQQAGMFTGATAQSALEGDANRQIQTGIVNQNARTGIMERGENAASNREGALATSRQNTSQANQTNQYNRGYQVNSALSGRTGQVADARRQGQGEYRGYVTGQQQYQGQQGNVANQNRLTNRGQTIQGRQGATNAQSQWELGNKQVGGTMKREVLPWAQLGVQTATGTKKSGSGW